jgi:hypothetical protein
LQVMDFTEFKQRALALKLQVLKLVEPCVLQPGKNITAIDVIH